MSPGFEPAACNRMNILRTREVWNVPARMLVISDKPTQGKGDGMHSRSLID